ncbi:MAG: hypothetical protein A3C93_02750 [Candidatus Lloydbacteria bacterium RIFCSPHIGHO2_02_FULL_54_17]|uniref:Prepilin-type N-terminal cleavage/methylation domain-containing protein n=1 Tax=Candidatus Lloydbacteria bacterium RIFCSPHIGHO2_02_FULL_54_17 TaxID=1798664 RepID=A0A1G2DDT1_9BACT|nr:MAG: hypothetical protein A2762_06000 [Candidatus Lloydbacteria bacterium RIFCSPHIGHO2_01_FULL_54_11]OGZ10938.1 MAG: hypothetical protein A3C93_02750 [Candidatus Lloydbacteria bacterium RIFCSPHIGHO2_02_FULL_54_17]OGZ14919.1 MAG: hypothetical protein A2948_05345 [Candidatus Lloydbacteria bacterium RIFCSPLOWO2_01_FULL_54_18]
MKQFRRRTGTSRGFSIVELLVAVGIFLVLSATFLFNYGSFDRRVTVDILAHQIAGWVRDAQVSAMSVKRARNDDGKFPGYGLYFDMAAKNKFVFFADLNGDLKYTPYDPGTSKCGNALEECEQEILLLHGNTIDSICGDEDSGSAGSCASVNPGNPSLFTTDFAHVVFVRPNPFDATILGDPDTAPTRHSHVEVTIASPKGYRHTITIWITGQVSVR